MSGTCMPSAFSSSWVTMFPSCRAVVELTTRGGRSSAVDMERESLDFSSCLFKLVATVLLERDPWSVVLSLFSFGPRGGSPNFLARLGVFATARNCLLISSASPWPPPSPPPPPPPPWGGDPAPLRAAALESPPPPPLSIWDLSDRPERSMVNKTNSSSVSTVLRVLSLLLDFFLSPALCCFVIFLLPLFFSFSFASAWD